MHLWAKFLNTEAKLRFANTSEENAKKTFKQAKQSGINQNKKLKKPQEFFFAVIRRITFSYLLHDCL